MHRIAFIYLLNDSRPQNRPSTGHGQSGYQAASLIYRLIVLASDITSALARGLRRPGSTVSGRTRPAARGAEPRMTTARF